MDEYDLISEYLSIAKDADAPIVPKPVLQRFDNYQIYSLICCDYPVNETVLQKSRITIFLSQVDTGNVFAYTYSKDFDSSREYNYRFTSPGSKAIAYQRFAPIAIPINFDDIATKLNIKPRDSYNWRMRVSTTTIGTYEDSLQPNAPYNLDLYSLYDINPSANSFYQNPYNYIKGEISVTGNGDNNPPTYRRFLTILQDRSIVVEDSTPRLDMFALVGGYAADPKKAANNYPVITPTKTGRLSIGYYRANPYEPMPNIISLDWYTYQINLNKAQKISIPLIDPVFGTLVFDGDPELISDLKSQLVRSGSDRYQWSDYYAENIDSTISQWLSIYNSFPATVPAPVNGQVYGKNYFVYSDPIQRTISANNNHWNNDANNYVDTNFLATHSLFKIRDKQAYQWHIEEQSDGTYGSLVMDSPKIKDIWYALDAGKYALNSLDPTKPRVTNIGHLVEKAAFLLGYRPDENGKVDRVKEKDEIVRKQINKRDPSVAKSIQDGDYSPACFADKGMVIKRLPNEIKNGRIVEGQVEKVHDIPQILASILDQLNESLGIQEGSNIQLPLSNKGKATYPNQLALLLDIARTLAEINEYTRSTRITAMVTHQQVGEILAATGLEPIAKFIEVSSDGKTTAQIPYWGIHPKESLRTSIDNVTANVGILLGQIGV